MGASIVRRAERRCGSAAEARGLGASCLFLSFLLLIACRPDGGAPSSAQGELEARWTDSAGTAQLVAPAEANWCPRDSMLEILAVRRDSAVGLALYARDSLRAEGYPVFQAGVFAPWRPQATAALRLVYPLELRSYESSWGQVQVTEAGGGRVSGRFDLHLKRNQGSDSVQVTGRFTRLLIRPAPASCGRANKPATP